MGGERVDLDAFERVINRPHVIELREDGWTLMHPPACHPDLFGCAVNLAAGRDLVDKPPLVPGRYFCELGGGGFLVIGGAASDSEGIDWAALVAELRVARTFRDDIDAALAPGRWRGFDGPGGVSTHEVIADVAAALKRYDRHDPPPTRDQAGSP